MDEPALKIKSGGGTANTCLAVNNPKNEKQLINRNLLIQQQNPKAQLELHCNSQFIQYDYGAEITEEQKDDQ